MRYLAVTTVVLVSLVSYSCGGSGTPPVDTGAVVEESATSAAEPAAEVEAPIEAEAGTVEATVTRIEGTLEARAAGGAWAPVEPGDNIQPGTELRTSDESNADLLVANECAVRLEAGTRITLEEDRLVPSEDGGPAAPEIRIALAEGRLLHRFDGLRGTGGVYNLRAPSAGAVIRGTMFAAEITENATAVHVLSGSVEVENDLGSVTVGEGQGTLVEEGEAPTNVRALIDQELDALSECPALSFVVVLRRTRRMASIAEAANIQRSLDYYRAINGRYPNNLDEADLGEIQDSWGRDYLYEVSDDGTSYRVWSIGEDGRPNTADDIPLIGGE